MSIWVIAGIMIDHEEAERMQRSDHGNYATIARRRAGLHYRMILRKGDTIMSHLGYVYLRRNGRSYRLGFFTGDGNFHPDYRDVHPIREAERRGGF